MAGRQKAAGCIASPLPFSRLHSAMGYGMVGAEDNHRRLSERRPQMEKRTLLLLTLVPVLAGYLLNLVLFIPVLGTLLFYLLPLAVTGFWFWLGGQFRRAG